MRTAYLVLLIFLLGCVQPAEEQANLTSPNLTSNISSEIPPSNVSSNASSEQLESSSCSDGVKNQGEEGIDCGGPCEPCAEEAPQIESVLQDFGLSMEGEILEQELELRYTYDFPECWAELVISEEECASQSSQDSIYSNTTWCEDGKKHVLSTKCSESIVPEIKSRIISEESSITDHIKMYSSSGLRAITVRVVQNYEWGGLEYVYTNHAEYPAFKDTFILSGKQVFCSDDFCKQAYVMVDHPASYVIISTQNAEQTKSTLNEFISDNLSRIHDLDFSPLSVFSQAYAYNRGVKVCYNPNGLIIAEKTKVDWPADLFFSDKDFAKLYAPFSYYYDSSFWNNPRIIGAQIESLTGEYSEAEKLGEGEYRVCDSQKLACEYSCSVSGGLTVGGCPSAGGLVLEDVLDDVVTRLNALHDFNSHQDLECFFMFNEMGENYLTGSYATGNGAVLLRTQRGEYPLDVIFLKGSVDSEVLQSTINRRHSVDSKVTRVASRGDCIEYRYPNGYGLVCEHEQISVIAFTNCVVRADCRSVIDELMEVL